jgi:hypothetical protein
MLTLRRLQPLAFAALFLVLVPVPVTAAGVEVRFDLATPSGSPFPSDRFTVEDRSHLTGLRVDLPKPDCAVRPSDCADLDVLNTLDGFNLQPRLAIPFTGPIDPATATSDAIFLVRLTDRHDRHDGHHGRWHRRRVVGINQVVWDPPTNTLYAESDELLDQHARWLLVITDRVRDPAGDPVEGGDFARFRHHPSFGQAKDHRLKAYRKALLDALAEAALRRPRIVGASVFTTQSATAVLEKIRRRLKAATPAPATFALGTGGEPTVFPLLDVTGIVFGRQESVAGPLNPVVTPFAALHAIPGAVGAIAFGKFLSPDYETPERFIPPIGTRFGVPVVQGTNEIYFNLFLPAGPAPAGGWPVTIFGHGFGDNKNSSPFVVAASMAANGVATIAINVVGHGRGPAGTLTVSRLSGPPVVLPAGGRGIDQDGNGVIDSTEGVNAAPPRTLIGSRDGLRQTVADLMQLVRAIEVGVDVDGDGARDLDPGRIYYFGQSFGGIYGTKFLAVEPSVRAGVPNVPGGPIIDIARLSPVFRGLVTLGLGARVPPLLNALPVAPPLLGFNENLPLRDLPPVVNTVPGATDIQQVIEHTEWASQSGNPVAYAPHLRAHPLRGLREKSVIVQVAKGDQTVPNPTASAILRAGDLADRTTYFRNDLVVADMPTAPKNAHTFLTNIAVPTVAALALAAQQQIGHFFATDGLEVIDPDGPGAYFEVPIVGPLPETLNFIP